MKMTARFRVYHFVHNVIAHPLLFLTDPLMNTRFESIALEARKFHDNTIPDEDQYNIRRFDEEK